MNVTATPPASAGAGLLVIARASIRPETRERFLEAAQACIAATRTEPGCLAYDMYESATRRDSFVFVESWQDRAALNRHFTLTHLRDFMAVAGACVAAPPVIEVVEPRSVDRL